MAPITNRTGLDAPIPWRWPRVDAPVDLSTMWVTRLEHQGPYPLWQARERPRAGAVRKTTHLAHLVKTGERAINERICFILARWLDLPSQIVRWTTGWGDEVGVAIRHEPSAVPISIMAFPTELRVENREGQSIWIANPEDFARHLGLTAFVEDRPDRQDSPRFMVRQGVLFRIDCDEAIPRRPRLTEAPGEWLLALIRQIRQLVPQHDAGFTMTLNLLAQAPEVIDLVMADLELCPTPFDRQTRFLVRSFLTEQQRLVRDCLDRVHS